MHIYARDKSPSNAFCFIIKSTPYNITEGYGSPAIRLKVPITKKSTLPTKEIK